MPRATDQVLSEGWIGDKKADYEGLKIPSGVDAALVGSQYYAYQTTYQDGTKEIQWFRRGPGAGIFPGLTGAKPPPDAVLTTSEETIGPLKEKWDAAQQKGAPTVSIGGVPHQVVGQDANGRDIYGPVQTATGPATAAASAAAQKPNVVQVEGTPLPGGGFDNTKPVMASHWPDGRVTYEPLTGPERQEWDREQAGLPSAAVSKAETDKAAAARQAQQDERQRQIDAQNLATAKAAADAKNEPQVIYREIKNPDGSTKNVQVRVHPGGREEVLPSAIPGQPAPREAINVHRNPDTGEWEEVYRDPATGRAAVRVVPDPNRAAAKSPAPLLPQIVVNQSQDALRTAYTQIQDEVDKGRRNVAWGENRRKEVFEAAQLTVQEAQLVEQSRQANQTTRFNISNTVLQYGQSALENALKFTLEINDKLKPGSGSGGRMFAALFNMQMQMAKDSGIYDQGVPQGSSVGQPGQPARPGQPAGAPSAQSAPRLSNVGDPAAVEADHQRSLAQLAAGDAADAAAAAASPGGRALTPAYSTPGASNVPGVAPTMPPTAPSGGAAVPPPVPMPQPAAAPGADVGPAGPMFAPRQGPPAPMPATKLAPGFGDPGFTMAPPAGGLPVQDPGFSMPPSGGGLPLQDPGFSMPGDQRQGFAALDALRQQFAGRPRDPAAPMDQPFDPMGAAAPMQGAVGIPPALQRAQVAATPPWRLPPQDLESLVQQHGADTVFGWPGQSLLGVG